MRSGVVVRSGSVRGGDAMDDRILQAAEAIRSKYQETAHPGLRGGQMDRQFIAGQAAGLREALTILLATLLRRDPTREEIADWLAGRSQLVPVPLLEPPVVVDAPDPVPAFTPVDTAEPTVAL